MQEPGNQSIGKKSRAAYPEINEIGNDLQSLKSNVGELATHVKKDGLKNISELAREEYRSFAEMGHRLEERIKNQPVQSIALAFAGGLLASLFFGRR